MFYKSMGGRQRTCVAFCNHEFFFLPIGKNTPFIRILHKCSLDSTPLKLGAIFDGRVYIRHFHTETFTFEKFSSNAIYGLVVISPKVNAVHGTLPIGKPSIA